MSNIWDDNLHLQDILFSFILSLYLSSLSLLVHWTLLLLFCSFAPLWSTTLLYVLVSSMYCTVLCSLHTCNFTFCQWTPLLLFALVLCTVLFFVPFALIVFLRSWIISFSFLSVTCLSILISTDTFILLHCSFCLFYLFFKLSA